MGHDSKATARWRKANPDKLRKMHARYQRGQRARKRAVIQEFKAVGCMDCGIKYPYWVMHCDHARGIKEFDINNKSAYSITRLKEELKKCDPVCANCHAERTYRRAQETAAGVSEQ